MVTAAQAVSPPMPRSRFLEGQVAIITGSDSGIGRAMAEMFAAHGADVAITFRTDAAGAGEAVQAVEAAGRHAIRQKVDVREEADVAALFEAVTRTLGVPTILVNNAGRNAPVASVADTTTADFDDTIRTNLYGAFFCCREFVRARKRAGGGGKIVNVTSVHEAIPSPDNAAYGAAKGGLLTFTRSLALEVAPLRINVNALAPGHIRTPMTAGRTRDPKIYAQEMKNIPWHRPGEPAEVARLALYLVSPEADYVTGQSFTIDGGLKMNWGQGA
ncbi:glucose-1-dehydrogenase [Azorhizobium oxalatiphilum]|uniref:Glucose-1-dehydrogenase n=1 Tax=Azorhizobium oxalatiphilum TaxID=980631 RepID=A0A917CEF6_9HYPH|nr:SDR family oxidoreductase [Azorhizobium oxalatiphilum]GGF85285.1 glucose-1-dehydrogenase [Azorhizobium oxalatiphilum]